MRNAPLLSGWNAEHRRDKYVAFTAADNRAVVGRPPTMLIIDDDEGTREIFELVLRREGFQVATVGSGTEGIESAKRNEFDVIVVDLRLKDVSGLDVIHALRDVRHGQIILMSAFLSLETAVLAMKLGAFDALEKPLDPQRLIAIIRMALTVAEPGRAQRLGHSGQRGFASGKPRSVIERWTGYVIGACFGEKEHDQGDLRTLEDWAKQ